MNTFRFCYFFAFRSHKLKITFSSKTLFAGKVFKSFARGSCSKKTINFKNYEQNTKGI